MESPRQTICDLFHSWNGADDIYEKAIFACNLSDALLALGYAAEWQPDEAVPMMAKLTESDRQIIACLLLESCRVEEENILMILASAKDAPPDFYDVPLLSGNPRQAERLQEKILQALIARERLQRFRLAMGEMFGEKISMKFTCDAELRELLQRCAVLGPKRSGLAADLPDPASPDHWWFTEIISDEEDEEMSEEEELARNEAADIFKSFLRERLSPDGVLVLSRDEARALLSTEEGQNLADYLAEKGNSLDLSSAELTPEEIRAELGDMTVGDALRQVYDGNPPDWVKALMEKK